MPTYDYLCTHCGRQIEIMHPMSEEPRSDCEACGKPALKRLISGGGALIFKGSGFYETDYRRKPQKSTGKDSGDSGKAKESTPKKDD